MENQTMRVVACTLMLPFLALIGDVVEVRTGRADRPGEIAYGVEKRASRDAHLQKAARHLIARCISLSPRSLPISEDYRAAMFKANAFDHVDRDTGRKLRCPVMML